MLWRSRKRFFATTPSTIFALGCTAVLFGMFLGRWIGVAAEVSPVKGAFTELVLFMVAAVEEGGLGLTDQTATAIYGLYTAAVFLGSLPGGWIADRLMGAQAAVWVGGIIIMCGHFILAVPSDSIFFLGLIVIVLGTGLLKPNITAIVGELYEQDDPRRDSGFTIFYMGINLGAALGPLACGWLALQNWHYGFAAAGVGMLFGLVQFRLTRHHLGNAGRHPDSSARPSDLFRRRAWATIGACIAVLGFLLVAGMAGWLQYDPVWLAQAATYAEYIAVELDDFNGDMMPAIEESYQYLTSQNIAIGNR